MSMLLYKQQEEVLAKKNKGEVIEIKYCYTIS
jgi:hypothetical protein